MILGFPAPRLPHSRAPEATLGPELSVTGLWALPSAGAAKVSSPRIALEQPRVPFKAVGAIGDSSSVRRPRPRPTRQQKGSQKSNAWRFSEGLPVLREPASPVSAARRAKAQAARREPRPWMAEASVRRRGTGDPEATRGPEQLGPLGVLPMGGAVGRGGKSLVAPHRFRPVTRAVQSGRRDRGLLERSPTPALSSALAKKPDEQRLSLQRGLWRHAKDPSA